MKIKRTLIQICLLTVWLLPAAVQAQFAYMTNGDNTITITNYTGSGGAVTIPSTINGLPVTGIGNSLFNYNLTVTSIAIPASVHYIGAFAFIDCNNLAAINVDVANTAFSSAAGVLFNKNQTVLLAYPGGLAGAYTIPLGVTSIGYTAFYDCYRLKDVTIPNSVTNIGVYAFYSSGLIGVTIPASVTSIGYAAFADSGLMNGIYFHGNAPILDPDGVFLNDAATVYYAADTTGWGATYDGLQTVLSYPNLVINGNFETGDFSGWTFTSFGYNNTIVPSPHSGLYAAQFSKSASGLASVVMSQTLPTQPNQVYLLSLWVNGVSNGGGLVDWNGTTLVNEPFGLGWTHLAYVVTAASTSTVLKFVTAYDITALDDVSVVPLLNYNRLTARLLNGGAMQLSFQGNLNANYALDRTFNLLPPINWTPQSTNTTDANGVLLLNNIPVSTTNNFWRIRSVP